MRATSGLRVRRDVRAFALVEYALILCPIAVVAFVFVKAFGHSVTGIYVPIAGAIATICRGC